MSYEANLINLDRSEYGTLGIDTYLLRQQIIWLAGLETDAEERDGILNLLESIQDLTDDEPDEDS